MTKSTGQVATTYRRFQLRVRKGQAFVGFSARVDKAERQLFEVNMPQHGARIWFIQSALKQLLRRVEENPALVEEINAQIVLMLSTKTDDSLGGVEFPARVHEQDYQQFNELFPQYGATSWFVRSVLKQFNEASRSWPTSPRQVEMAVDTVLTGFQPVR